MKKIIIAILLLLPVIANAGWTPNSDVLAIRAYPSSTGHYIKISTSSVSGGCTSTATGNGVYFVNDETGRIISILLAAQAANKKVSLHISGCGGGPYGKITEVQIGEVAWGSQV